MKKITAASESHYHIERRDFVGVDSCPSGGESAARELAYCTYDHPASKEAIGLQSLLPIGKHFYFDDRNSALPYLPHVGSRQAKELYTDSLPAVTTIFSILPTWHQ